MTVLRYDTADATCIGIERDGRVWLLSQVDAVNLAARLVAAANDRRLCLVTHASEDSE